MRNQQSIKDRIGWQTSSARSGDRGRSDWKPKRSRGRRDPVRSRQISRRSDRNERNKKSTKRRQTQSLVRNGIEHQRTTNNRRVLEERARTTPMTSADEIVLETEFLTIPVFLFCQKFTAALDTSRSLTKIGQDIANIAVTNGFEIKEKTVILEDIRKKVTVITILLGTKMAQLRPVECIIDRRVSSGAIVLGLKALSTLNAQIFVDQIRAVYHTVAQRTPTVRQRIDVPAVNLPEEPFQEDEFVAALTEAERKEMESWE